MEGILWAIRKPHTDNIKSGKKTIEVRKLIPKDLTPETPNFIYETKANGGCGKVIGEFKCKKTTKYEWLFPWESEDFQHALPQGDLEKTCLEDYELDNYLGDKAGYGLHITDLKIYDKPKDLREFRTILKCGNNNFDIETCCMCNKALFDEDGIFIDCDNLIKRPPQSYCYVEI